MEKRIRIATAAVAGFVALNAVIGGIGFLGGGIDMGPVITSRFPWHSPVVAGSALLVAVAAPMISVVFLALRRDRRWSGAAMAAGLALICWIVLQLLVIRTYSWLQPASVAAGLVVFAGGRWGRRAPDVPGDRGLSPASPDRRRHEA
ncbi:putative membrane protein YfcA [Saccharothrix longispora]|uniref:Membrane protein YfcA n=2 Tax=Saccharothrix longispora TaxID=33920 RepID=A0ABU1PU35_9PSEU|nr:hypothetical protein [Saccharothrix longispora]MDR6594153.1 putative membrane protein YfcA [Saccharothrix longispora]